MKKSLRNFILFLCLISVSLIPYEVNAESAHSIKIKIDNIEDNLIYYNNGTADMSIPQVHYKDLNTGDEVWCIEAGYWFSSVPDMDSEYDPNREEILHADDSFDVSKCQSSTDSPQCALQAIVQKGLSDGLDYVAINTALRLYAVKYLNRGFGSYGSIGPAYLATANYALSNSSYNGNKTSGLPTSVMFSDDSSFSDGLALFREAVDGIKVSSPNPKVIEPTGIVNAKDGTVHVVVETSLSSESKIISVVPKNSNVTVYNYTQLSPCGNEKYCLSFDADISGVSSGVVTFTVKYELPGSTIIKLYNHGAGEYARQRFIGIERENDEGEFDVSINVTGGNPGTCSGKIKYDMPDDCDEVDDSNPAQIKDPEACALLNTDEGIKSNYKKDYGNEYCDVFCRETLSFTFMDKETAIAGRYFQHNVNAKHSNLSYLSTVILSSRQCISVIDYSRWEKDYIEANDRVRTTWNTYKETEAQKNHEESHDEYAETSCGPDSCDCGCDRYCDPPNEGDCCDSCTYPGEALHASDSWTWYDSPGAYYNRTDEYGNEHYTNAYRKSGSSSYSSSCDSCAGSVYLRGDAGSPVSVEYDPYVRALAKRDELEKKIKNCNFVEGTDSYNRVMNYVPKNQVKMDYYENSPEGGENYAISIANDKTPVYVNRYGYYNQSDKWADYCSGECENDLSSLSKTSYYENNLLYWVCSGSEGGANCDDDTAKVFPNNTITYIQVESETLHYQKQDFYTQVYTGKVDTMPNDVGYWIPLEPHVWPVSANRPSGEYDISIEYYNLGDQNRVVKFNSGDLTCGYKVKNDLNVYDCDDGYHICYDCDGPCPDDGNDMGVYFRTIDLTDVFPNSQFSPSNQNNIAASRRRIGSNWNTSNAHKVIDNIQKLGNEIWNNKPQYVITLTPSMIKDIKNYNKGTNYLDNSLKCGSNLYCTSNFLNGELKDIMGNKYEEYYDKDSTIKLNSLYNYIK